MDHRSELTAVHLFQISAFLQALTKVVLMGHSKEFLFLKTHSPIFVNFIKTKHFLNSILFKSYS